MNAPETPHTPRRMPSLVFGLELTYLVLLMALFVVYRTDHALRAALPVTLGPLPMGVVWFGAVGGVMAGLFGIYFHNTDWDSGYDYWHYSRPFVGAVVGGVGALLYYVAIAIGNKASVRPDALTFYAVAFLLAFGDHAFQSLIHRVTKVLFGPGDASSGSGRRPPGPDAPQPQ